eukprot:15463017-Alexandrium_andersonii.AAC.1
MQAIPPDGPIATAARLRSDVRWLPWSWQARLIEDGKGQAREIVRALQRFWPRHQALVRTAARLLPQLERRC